MIASYADYSFSRASFLLKVACPGAMAEARGTLLDF